MHDLRFQVQMGDTNTVWRKYRNVTDSCNGDKDNTALNCETWENWQDWSGCSVTCNGGESTRKRECVGGQVGELVCQGPAVENRPCNTQLCPVWNTWGLWTDCTVTCGRGRKTRRRSCNAGSDVTGKCIGDDMETQACGEQACPVWREWSRWSPCSTTCGPGQKTRQRSCNGGEVGSGACIGSESEEIPCSEKGCPTWDEWDQWSPCDVTCGGGQKVRRRTCDGDEGTGDCLGNVSETTSCNSQQCESWGEWEAWTECSVTCGDGNRARIRSCNGGTAGQGGCLGSALQSGACSLLGCPTWSDWGSWSQCNATCGEGHKIRVRACQNGTDGIDCSGESIESTSCLSEECPTWGTWGNWGGCSVTCGQGSTTRARSCDRGKPGVDCPGSSIEERNCSESLCPEWSSWSQWSECSLTCGDGESIRTRTCVGGVTSADCDGDAMNTRICNMNVCPEWTSWGDWSDCSVTCGNGILIRSRICEHGLARNDCPGDATQAKQCNNTECEQWSEWGEWTQCSTTCGGGERTRTRLCDNGQPGVGGCTGSAQEIDVCGGTSADECPEFSQWSTWSNCSSSCGGGVKRRSRICINGHLIGGCGDANVTEEIACNTQACPSWSDWSAWDDCSRTCDGGARQRTRECINGVAGEVGCEFDGEIGEFEAEVCLTQACATWGIWSPWSACTKTCDGGVRERARECFNGKAGEPGCEFEDDIGEYTSEDCNQQLCPRFSDWGDWSACNASCGGQGIRVHTRVCLNGVIGQLGCEGPVSEDQECFGDACAFWSIWSDFSECSATCGSGFKTRGRLCVKGEIGEPGCEGADTNERQCNEQACASWSEWGTWTSCSFTCGEAVKSRNRICINGEIGESGCDEGSSTGLEACPVIDCAVSGCQPDLELIGLADGDITCTIGTQVGSDCTFSCNDDYVLDGNASITCNKSDGENPQWSSVMPKCTGRCSDAVDIVFIIDSSSSIGKANFRIVRSFIKGIVKRFRIGPDAAQIGAIRYNNKVSRLWDLNDYSTKKGVIDAIDNMQYDGSGTRTGNAILYTHNYMFRASAGRRPGVPKVAVVITDGISFDDIVEPSKLIKNQGVQMVAVGIGRARIADINEIASDPDRNFATSVTNFDSLPRVVTTIADQIRLCKPIEIPDNCPPQALADILFIVDSSSSIGDENFELMRQFIKDVISEFYVGRDSAMFGLVLYNRKVTEYFTLKEYTEGDTLISAIDRMPYEGVGTRTGSALEYAAANSLTELAGAREGIPKVAIVITDGKSQDNVAKGAAALKKKAEVIAIGIKGALLSELNQIATVDANVFTTNFQKLGEVMEGLKLAVCFATKAARLRLQ